MPDIFYNLLKFDILTPSATPTLGTEIKFPLTLTARETKDKAIVTEIIGIRWGASQIERFIASLGTASTSAFYNAALSFRALTAGEVVSETGALTIGDINILDTFSVSALESVDTAVGVQQWMLSGGGVYSHDLTFGTGLGRLIPGDRIFFNQDASQDASQNADVIGIEIAYRQQLVGFEEWRGILAGYQQDGAA